jgi:hypothetical protein
MPATILGENALQLPAGTTRPTGSNGMIRYDTTNRSLENYHNLISGTDNWYGTGKKQLIARAVRTDAWNAFDIVWGHSNARYLGYEIYFLFGDPATTASRLFCQVFDVNGNLYSPSSPNNNGYSYVDNWGAANDGADGAGQNYNVVNNNGQNHFPITNWFSANSGYWASNDGESNIAGTIKLYNSIPSGFTSDFLSFDGTYAHNTVSFGLTQGRFGGVIFNMPGGTSTRGVQYHPITGIRIGWMDGHTIRSVSSGVNALVNVYGLTGTEEREL